MEADSLNTRVMFALGRFLANFIIDTVAIFCVWGVQHLALWAGANAYNMSSLLRAMVAALAMIYLAQNAWCIIVQLLCAALKHKPDSAIHWSVIVASGVLIAETLAPPSACLALVFRGDETRLLTVVVITRTLEVYGIWLYFLYRCVRYDAWPLVRLLWSRPATRKKKPRNHKKQK